MAGKYVVDLSGPRHILTGVTAATASSIQGDSGGLSSKRNTSLVIRPAIRRTEASTHVVSQPGRYGTKCFGLGVTGRDSATTA